MKQSDITAFTKSMYNMASIYAKDLNDNIIKLYFVALNRYEYDDVERAFGETVARNKFFPKPAELIELIEGNEDELIDMAYQDIKRIIYNGFHHALALANPITMAVVEAMGGQQSFYNAVYVDKHDDTAAYFEFKRLYKIYLKQYKETGELPVTQYLPGYMDKLPGAESVKPSNLKLIGLPLPQFKQDNTILITGEAHEE